MKSNFWHSFKNYLEKYGIWLILCLAAFLRLVGFINPNVFYATTSELYRDLSVVYDLVVKHQVVYLGPSASLGGFWFGAVYYYLLAPFVWLFGFYPHGAVLMSTFFSISTVYVFYRILYLWFAKKEMALIGAFLLSVSMFDIQFAYYVSNPNNVPLFLLGFFYCFTLWLERRAKWYHLVLGAACISVATQLHATALLILPLTVLLVMGLKGRFPKPKEILIAGTSFLALYTPYIIYEAQHGLENLARIFQLGGQNFSIFIKWQSVRSIAEFVLSSYVFKNDYFQLASHNANAYYFLLVAFGSLMAAAWLYYRSKATDSPVLLKISALGYYVLVCWVSVSLLVFLFFQQNIPPFYFVVLWPAPLVFFSWFLFLLRKKNSLFFAFILCGFIAAQAVSLLYFYRNLHNDNYDHKSLLEGFNGVVENAGGESFKIFDGTDNKALFAYYLRLSGAQEQMARHNAKLLYFVYNDPSLPTIEIPDQNSKYLLLEEFNSGSLKVVKMLKK